MKKTFLYDSHVSLGAKMAPFGGFEMPIQYEGILIEHFATRKASAMFDTCHMGEFWLSGASSVLDLDAIISCPVATLPIGQCRYGFLCNQNGGVNDDLIIYRMSDTDFFIVVNAGTQDGDFECIASQLSPTSQLKNISGVTGKIDVQGPAAAKIVRGLLELPIDTLRYYHWMYNKYKGKQIIVSRTGYTGEIGFEVYLDEQQTVSFWNDCLQAGVKPAGLGCRDTLRLEMGYPLYGHELDDTRNAAESGFSRAISAEKKFTGSSVVLDSSKACSKLCGIKLEGRRTVRNGDIIVNDKKEQIGMVTSGSYSPSLEYAIALGYVKNQYSEIGTKLILCAGKAELPGSVVPTPFYNNATARKKLSDYL